jgi:uncharacterized protein
MLPVRLRAAFSLTTTLNLAGGAFLPVLTRIGHEIKVCDERAEDDEKEKKKTQRAPGAAPRLPLLPGGAFHDQFQLERFRERIGIALSLRFSFFWLRHRRIFTSPGLRRNLVYCPRNFTAAGASLASLGPMAGPAISAPDSRKLVAYVAPMLLFVLLLGMGSGLKTPGAPFWRAAPEFWIYPLQTLLCALLLIYFRRDYDLRRVRKPAFALAIGLLVFFLWIAPQQFLSFAPRVVGFNPDILAGSPTLYWTTVVLRFLRLVVVVPLLEEIFWRGFLLRYLIAEDFLSVPFGMFSWRSFVVVTLGFGLSHFPADWPVALMTGALYNLVAYRTKNLAACILAHALTNFALGLWIVGTKQWGFW